MGMGSATVRVCPGQFRSVFLSCLLFLLYDCTTHSIDENSVAALSHDLRISLHRLRIVDKIRRALSTSTSSMYPPVYLFRTPTHLWCYPDMDALVPKLAVLSR